MVTRRGFGFRRNRPYGYGGPVDDSLTFDQTDVTFDSTSDTWDES